MSWVKETYARILLNCNLFTYSESTSPKSLVADNAGRALNPARRKRVTSVAFTSALLPLPVFNTVSGLLKIQLEYVPFHLTFEVT